jgi:hypothetical protein
MTHPFRFLRLFALTAPVIVQAAPQVVIHEIHYDPEPKTEHVEFIELYNAGDEAADLSGWRFNNGVDYTFAADVSLEPGGYLVLTENKEHFDKKFGSVLAIGIKAFDSWSDGTLNNDSDRITLVDGTGELVDEVDYQSSFPWPIAANGDGVSMELINADLDNDLGGSWRSASDSPTPNKANSVFAENAPPQIRQVKHSPKMPTTDEPSIITVKVSDPDSVAEVELVYQTVEPGKYIQSLLAKPSAQWKSSPLDPREPNPDFEDSSNWETVAMLDNGEGGDETAGDGIYTFTLPAQPLNRTLVRYRIVAEDGSGASVRVPYPADESRNFAYFVYNGVPDYVANNQTVHPDGAPYTHSTEVMTSLPVYFLLTDENEFNQCVAYSSGDQVGRDNFDARSAFNWSGTFVYDGVVYDHIKYRLRQRNDRYGGSGKRSFRFRFNRGYHAQFHDDLGDPYPTKWRTLNTSKLKASRGGYNYGLNEAVNNILWNLVDVPANATHWYHFRVVKERDEIPKGSIFGPNVNAQWTGDFFGMGLALEDYDSRFLDAHGLPDGNLYKLISTRLDGKDVQRVQGKFSVDDGSDFSNILLETRKSKDAAWLEQHINYDHYNRYHAIIEAVRHFDVAPNLAEHLKNRTFYFSPPTADRPLGLQHTLPWDSETSWGPNWNGGVDWVRDAMLANTEDREPLDIRYKNTVREIRDLIWQPDQINTMLDRLADKLEPFTLAEQDRWKSAPSSAKAGTESIPDDIREWVAEMKAYAWDGGSWVGGDGPTTPQSKDSGISGEQGRDDYLDWLAGDSASPHRPNMTYIGTEGFPIDDLTFTTSFYKSGTLFQPGELFASMEWRLAEITDPALPDYDPTDRFKWEWNATWESGPMTEFQESIKIPATALRAGQTYRARVRYTDAVERTSNWSDPIQFTPTIPAGVSDLLEDLRISEIFYHPSSATDEERAQGYSTSDFEYLELHNAGAVTLDLRGVRFTKGIDFDFDGSAITMLETGATLLVVSHVEAFTSRFGEGLPIAGAYGDSGTRLSDGGERLKLSFGGGTPIIDFTYNDKGDWPAEADGGGRALVLRSLESPGDLDTASSWVLSEALGGSPGTPGGGQSPMGPTANDTDRDGMSNDSEAIAGTDPNDATSVLKIISVDSDSQGLTFTWSSVDAKTYVLEHTATLANPAWTEVTQANSAAGESTSARDEDASRVNNATGYYRIRVQ